LLLLLVYIKPLDVLLKKAFSRLMLLFLILFDDVMDWIIFSETSKLFTTFFPQNSIFVLPYLINLLTGLLCVDDKRSTILIRLQLSVTAVH